MRKICRYVSLCLCIIFVLSITTTMSLATDVTADDTIPPVELPSPTQSTNPRINLYDRAWFASLRAPVYTNYAANYTHNTSLPAITGYILCQTDYSDYRIGNSNWADAGCGPIAVYNALKYNGRQMDICGIVRNYELNGYLMAAGYLGTDPYAIADYLDDNLVTYEEFPDNDSYSDFSTEVMNNINSRRVYIVSYWNGPSISDGVHTVAFATNRGQIYIYNRYSNSETVDVQSNLAALVSSERYITGYALGARSRIAD